MTDLPDVRPIFIDTSVVIQALRADPVTLSQLAAVETFISATVVGELYFGAHRSAHFDKEVSKITAFIAHSTIVPCDHDTGVLYGAIKDALQQSGPSSQRTICGSLPAPSSTAFPSLHGTATSPTCPA